MRNLSIAFALILLFFSEIRGQIGVNKLNTKTTQNLESSSEIKVDLIGGGALLSSNSTGTAQAQAKGGTGIALYKENDFQGSLLFNFGTNNDIDFSGNDNNGSALLIPANGGQSLQLDFRKNNILRKISKKEKLGYNFSLTAASANWKYDGLSAKADLLSSKLQMSWKFYGKSNDKINIMIVGDFGITYRGIFGDAASDPDLIKSIFGVDKKNYWGTELNIDLWLNDTRLFFGLPFIMGDRVKGLTNGQFIFGTSVNGTVLKNLVSN